MQNDKIGISFMEFRTVAGLKLLVEEIKSGAPNDGFLLNTLTTLFRLSRVLLDISKCIRLSRVLLDISKCILSGAIKFASVRSS